MKGFVTIHNFLPVEQACFKIKIMPNTEIHIFSVQSIYFLSIQVLERKSRINVSVAGNCGNQAFPEMPRQFQKCLDFLQ